MWRRAPKVEEDALLKAAVDFTGNAKLYGSFMVLVTQEWTFACEHNLTDAAMNRRAWIGHAAACMAIGSPEYITRRAWWMLTQEQRDAADYEATNAIELYISDRRFLSDGRQYEFEFNQGDIDNPCQPAHIAKIPTL